MHSLKLLQISWPPLALQLLVARSMVEKTWENRWVTPGFTFKSSPSLTATTFFVNRGTRNSRSAPLKCLLTLVFATAISWCSWEQSDLVFSPSLILHMYGNTLQCFRSSCLLPNLRANHPEATLRDLTCREIRFVEIFLTWSSHWRLWELHQAMCRS